MSYTLQLWFKMANLSDSEAHFSARASEYGVNNALIRALKQNGIETLATLAFAIGRPGQEFPEAAFDTWARDLNNGVAPSMGELASLRRLRFEAEVVITAALKASVEAPGQDGPKPIPGQQGLMKLGDD